MFWPYNNIIFLTYILQVYIAAWFTAPSAESSPRNDLRLLQDIYKYKEQNLLVAEVALKSFTGHLWYLSETLVGLSFFDSLVPDATKLEMVTALQKEGDEKPPRRIKVVESHIKTKRLSDFVSVNTLKLFTALSIEHGFLNDHPSTWKNNNHYEDGLNKIKGLRVVNDAAERGVALIQDFNGIITNQEVQKQYLLQVVEQHRKSHPNTNKTTII